MSLIEWSDEKDSSARDLHCGEQNSPAAIKGLDKYFDKDIPWSC